MKNKKNDMHRNALNDIFSVSSDFIPSPIVRDKEESKKEVVKEESKSNEIIKESKKSDTLRKTFNIPSDIIRDMGKIVYVDRDIKDNTDLLIKALRKYLESNEAKALLEEYNKIKGGK